MNWPTRRHILQKPVMILMGVGDQNAVDRGNDIEGFRQETGRALWRVQRSTDIQNNAMPVRRANFDAIPANLMSGAMNRELNFVEAA